MKKLAWILAALLIWPTVCGAWSINDFTDEMKAKLDAIFVTGGSTGDVLTQQADGTFAPAAPTGGGGTGDVIGPASATAGNFPILDATGRILSDSGTKPADFLTSLIGAVLTDQTTPQTIGATGSRLAMCWATDLTVTNAINGSVTGNAGTVTNGVYTTGAGTVFLAPTGDGSGLSGVLKTEVDGSTTNEIQTIDTAQLSGTKLQLSLSGDGESVKEVELSSLQDGIGTDDQTASEVSVTTTAFGGNLANDETSNTVQKCLDLLDDMTSGGTPDDGSVTTVKIAAETLVNASEGISGSDNDTTIATSAAIIDYVAANSGVFNWAGDWTTATGYNINDCVGNDGSGYICIANHTSGNTTEPGTGAAWETYWNIFVSKGDEGVPGTNTFAEVDVSTSQTLTAAQCSSGSQHNNYGQSSASVQNIPAAFEGGYFCVICTTTGQDLSYAPYPGTAFWLTQGGEAAELYNDEALQNSSTAMMDQLIFRAVRTGSGVYQWNVIVMQGSW